MICLSYFYAANLMSRGLTYFKLTINTFFMHLNQDLSNKHIQVIFHELIDNSMEIYIDDIVAKSTDFEEHLFDFGAISFEDEVP